MRSVLAHRMTASRLALCLAALAPLSLATGAHAQITVDGTMTHSAPMALSPTAGVYQIPADLGRVAGPNLFQSFQFFNLASDQTAVFTGPSTIHNIITRVTGGGVSTLDGRIDASAFPSVNFYFLNPAGIIVGPGASLSIPGSLYLSTASRISFADGSSMPMTATSVGTLSVADPTSFGFLGNNAAITFNGAGIDDSGVQHAATIWSGADIQGSRFHVSAGDIAFNNFGFQLGGGASPAEIDAVAVGRSTNIVIGTDDSGANAASGHLTATGGPDSAWSVSNSGAFGGGFFLAGGDVRLAGTGAMTGAPSFNLGATGGNIGIISSGDLALDGVFLTTAPSGSNQAGAITINVAGAATLFNSSGLSADAVGAGDGGTIDLTAQSLTLEDQSFIGADTFASGAAGTIRLHLAGLLSLSGTSSISADSGNDAIRGLAVAGSLGSAGSIEIDGGAITLASGAGIKATANGGGNAGLVLFNVNTLTLAGQSYIAADQLGTGPGGTVNITAGTVRLAGGAAIKSDNYGPGAGGAIRLKVGSLGLTDQSLIAIDTFGTGGGGLITIAASGDIMMSGTGAAGGSAISAQSGQAGQPVAGAAGSVQIQANALNLSEDAGIKVSSFGAGKAGDLTLNLASLALGDQSYIASDAFGTGAGGQIAISVTGNAGLSGQSAISSNSGDAQAPSMQAFGKAGDISLTAGAVTLSQGAGIKSNAFGSGNAGSIRIGAGTLMLADQSYLASDSYGAGAGGNIALSISGDMILKDQSVISADALLNPETSTPTSIQKGLSGGSGAVTVATRSLQLSNAAGIRTSTERAGAAGSIALTVETLALGGQSYVSSDAHATGNAGSVNVAATRSVMLSGSAFLGARSHDASNAGRVTITAPAIALAGPSQVSSEAFGAGAAGDVSLSGFDRLSLTGGASISSSSTGSGSLTAGVVSISGNPGAELSVTGGSSIKTDSASAAPAGDIIVSSDQILIDGPGSEISSANTSSSGGAAGEITVNTDPIILSNGGRITTNAASGPAGNIVLTFPGHGLLFLEGSTAPGVIATSSGTNTGGRITISRPYAIIMNGGRIEALGPAFQALVTIDADWLVRSTDRANDLAVAGRLVLDSQVEDVSRGTEELSVAFADAYGVLVSHCAATRSDGLVSTLDTGAVIGPYPNAPAAIACSGQKSPALPARQLSLAPRSSAYLRPAGRVPDAAGGGVKGRHEGRCRASQTPCPGRPATAGATSRG